MADFVGSRATGSESVAYDTTADGLVSALAYTSVVHALSALLVPAGGGLEFMHNPVAGPGKTSFVVNAEKVGLFYDVFQVDFFENFHVVPRSFDFGNVLSAQTSPLEVFPATVATSAPGRRSRTTQAQAPSWWASHRCPLRCSRSTATR